MKKVKIAQRRKEADDAKARYTLHMNKIKARQVGPNGELYVSESEYQAILKDRRDMARPTVQDYAYVCQWMKAEGIEYVHAPFEVDAQMKQLFSEGRVDAVITEDGDLIVYQCSCILSKFQDLHQY